MTNILTSRSKRAALLACSAVLLAAAPQIARASALWNVKKPAQDIGTLDVTTPITVTVWLKKHDQAAFDAAVQKRMTPGDADYHRWMSAAEVASYSATDADVAALTSALQEGGLKLVRRESDNSSVRVTGSAGLIAHAFSTAIHNFRHGVETFYAPVSEPRFAGQHAELIAGVTGITNAHMSPFVLNQLDFSTGKPRAQIAVSRVTGGTLPFTTDCFGPSKTIKITRFHVGGAVKGVWTGPSYVSSPDACGYTPAQVAAHYGLPAVYAAGYLGDGQTIVLVDGYGSPTIESDANVFSQQMGLPTLTSANFKIVYPDGQPTTSPYASGWTTEVSLDVEWAHAIAPNANIVLVVAPTDDDAEMAYVLHYAISHQLGDVISNSYGYPEAVYGPAAARAFNSAIEEAAAQGVNVDVSTGDSGDLGLGTPIGAASIPADSVYATGIGGTSLSVPSDNGPVDSVWGITASFLADLNGVNLPADFLGFQQGSGGGMSVYFEKPSWQKGIPGVGRQLPDISAVADPQTGAIIVAPNSDGTASVEGVIGGTSLSSPVFSGIWALAQQQANARLGQAGPIIAKMPAGALNDIVPIAATIANLHGTVSQKTTATKIVYNSAGLLNLTATQPNGFVGTAAVFGLDELYDLGFGADSSLQATVGWDTASGFGEPNGAAFVSAAAAAAAK